MASFRSKSIIKTISLSLIMSHAALAACDHERNEVREWTDKCNTAESAYQAAMIAGSTAGPLFAIGTLGLSIIGASAAISAACQTRDNFCRIKGEKESNLNNCLRRESERAREEAERARRREDSIRQIQHAHQVRRNQVEQEYREEYEELTFQYREAGEPANERAAFDAEIERIRQRRQQRLDELNAQEREEISRV